MQRLRTSTASLYVRYNNVTDWNVVNEVAGWIASGYVGYRNMYWQDNDVVVLFTDKTHAKRKQLLCSRALCQLDLNRM